MSYRTSVMATGLFFGLLVSLPASAAQGQSTLPQPVPKQSQSTVKTPQLRNATVRKPSGPQARQIEQFVRDNQDQIRTAQAKGNGC